MSIFYQKWNLNKTKSERLVVKFFSAFIEKIYGKNNSDQGLALRVESVGLGSEETDGCRRLVGRSRATCLNRCGGTKVTCSEHAKI